ncbi:vesicle-associated membrane protein 7 [Scomber scombrus]|uniref:Vesicle-associated membrane protein 7 n=1 Tax=Scomber scombrus TaxID=13677 RepID=A0AAV1PUS1_SCOSC
MAILFAVVARGTTILAKHAWCGGNFLEVTEQILAKIPSENNKLTYSHGSYLFHYICHDRIIYLCITDDDFERSRAFSFLSEVKKRFQTTYGSRAQTALPYAMNSEFSSTLAAQMKHHSDPRGSDRVTETQMQVDDLKGIMVRNIDLVAQRGEKLELLIDKTENLVDSSVTFKTTSRNLARAMCMKNLKLTIVIVLVCLVVLYIIVSAACGGLTWHSCDPGWLRSDQIRSLRNTEGNKYQVNNCTASVARALLADLRAPVTVINARSTNLMDDSAANQL